MVEELDLYPFLRFASRAKKFTIVLVVLFSPKVLPPKVTQESLSLLKNMSGAAIAPELGGWHRST